MVGRAERRAVGPDPRPWRRVEPDAQHARPGETDHLLGSAVEELVTPVRPDDSEALRHGLDGLAQAPLGALAFGDVDERRDDAVEVTGRVAQRHGVDGDHPRRRVRRQELDLAVAHPRLAAAQLLERMILEAVRGAIRREPPPGRLIEADPDGALARRAEHLLGGAIDELVASLGVEDEQSLGHRLDDVS